MLITHLTGVHANSLYDHLIPALYTNNLMELWHSILTTTLASAVYAVLKIILQVKGGETACPFQGVGCLTCFSLSIYNAASAGHDLHPSALLHILQAAAQWLGLFIKVQQWV